MVEILNKISDVVERFSLTIAQLFCVLMFVVIIALVISRYLFSYSFSWAEEVTRYLMIWMALLTAGVVLRRNQHIRVDIFSHRFSPKVHLFHKTVLNFLILIFLIILCKEGLSTALAMRQVSTSSLSVSMFWAYLSIPVSSLCMIVFISTTIVNDVLEMKKM